ncbi:probable F-box protein At4g22165 [Telopea speciosissima]|uniref:probable F-box protein At4g22165 n=1 Tax=Telopea speciosissima TaxID=54955 RepID=UPI001CC76318|nr:probable F-box protein At4g22165 [Telopea speciosissima]
MTAATQPQPKDWSELPEDLVVMINERNSALARTRHHHPVPSRPHQYFPFLFLPYEDDKDNRDNHLNGLPSKEFRRMYCPGSSHGWLVVVEENTSSMYLINPFTRAQLPLPPMSKVRILVGKEKVHCNFELGNPSYSRVRKVVLSSSPSSSSSNVVAIAIYGGFSEIGFSKPGDKAWTRFGDFPVMDVLFYRNHIYAVRKSCSREIDIEILVYHMGADITAAGGGGGGPVPKLVDIIKPPEGYQTRWRPYLVVSCGDLLIIERDVLTLLNDKQFDVKTVGFRVFKLCRLRNSSDDNNKTSSSTAWEQIKNLGDRMLFLGVNSSLSLSSHDFPPGSCRGNCIYFTHRHDCVNIKQGWGYDDMAKFDMGIFNLEDKHIEPFPLESSFTGNSLTRLCPPPIWLTPSTI